MSACSDDLGIASFLCHWVFHLRSPNTQEYRTQQGRAAKQSFNWCMGTRRRGEAEVRGPGVSIPQFHWPFLSNDPVGFHLCFLLSLLSKTAIETSNDQASCSPCVRAGESACHAIDYWAEHLPLKRAESQRDVWVVGDTPGFPGRCRGHEVQRSVYRLHADRSAYPLTIAAKIGQHAGVGHARSGKQCLHTVERVVFAHTFFSP